MLSGGQFYDVLCAVLPLYVALFLGYGSLRWWGVVTPEQSAGIGRFNAFVAIPALIFEIIAFNNPYTMNNLLIAAYSLSNVIVLVALCAWAWCAKSGSFDWVITLFQLSVMPNTIIVGIPVLSPLYSITEQGIAAIFIGQVLWLLIILFLYELRAAWLEKVEHPVLVETAELHGNTIGELQIGSTETSTEAAADASRSRENGLPALVTDAEHDECHIKINGLLNKSVIKVRQEKGGEVGEANHTFGDVGNQDTDDRDNKLESGHDIAHVRMDMKQVAVRVVKKMLHLPLTYSTLLGIGYSLIASRWGFGPPRVFQNSLDIIGRITLGLTMYTIGLFMAGEKKLITSWWVSLFGAFFRFIVGPAAMALASIALGLRGDTLRFCVLQAALPQAVISFVFAKEHNLHTNVFSTAVSIQTLVFMPIVLAYYTLVGL